MASRRYRIAQIVSCQSIFDTKGGVERRRVVGNDLPIRRLRLMWTIQRICVAIVVFERLGSNLGLNLGGQN